MKVPIIKKKTFLEKNNENIHILLNIRALCNFLKVLKYVKKSRKKVFLGINPGLKSELGEPKTIKKTSFIQVVPRIKGKEKFVSLIYPGYQMRGLPV